MWVKLKHSSSVPGATGEVGDIVECSDAQGEAWLKNNAAERADAPVSEQPKKRPARKKKPAAEEAE